MLDPSFLSLLDPLSLSHLSLLSFLSFKTHTLTHRFPLSLLSLCHQPLYKTMAIGLLHLHQQQHMRASDDLGLGWWFFIEVYFGYSICMLGLIFYWFRLWFSLIFSLIPYWFWVWFFIDFFFDFPFIFWLDYYVLWWWWCCVVVVVGWHWIVVVGGGW